MARLIDRLRTETHVTVGTPLYQKGSEKLVGALIQQAVPIVCDNVARLWDEQDMNVYFKDMPPLAPPFKLFWMEAREPRPGAELFESWGAVCGVRDLHEPGEGGFYLRKKESNERLQEGENDQDRHSNDAPDEEQDPAKQIRDHAAFFSRRKLITRGTHAGCLLARARCPIAAVPR